MGVAKCIANVPQNEYTIVGRLYIMEKENKTYSMSIRVSGEELERLKQAARLEAYASYSEFVRRTALIEAAKVIDMNSSKDNKKK